MSGRDKVVFTDGKAVGVRRDLNGILLLDTALQTPISKTEDIVRVELSLPEVGCISPITNRPKYFYDISFKGERFRPYV